jgi:hypothetical protein
MKSLFVPYKIAKLAKEKGFDEPCLAYYGDLSQALFGVQPNDKISFRKNSTLEESHNNKNITSAAPLYQQLVDWFREKHLLILSINLVNDHWWSWSIIFVHPDNTTDDIIPDSRKDNYHNSLNEVLEEAFKLI